MGGFCAVTLLGTCLLVIANGKELPSRYEPPVVSVTPQRIGCHQWQKDLFSQELAFYKESAFGAYNSLQQLKPSISMDNFPREFRKMMRAANRRRRNLN